MATNMSVLSQAVATAFGATLLYGPDIPLQSLSASTITKFVSPIAHLYELKARGLVENNITVEVAFCRKTKGGNDDIGTFLNSVESAIQPYIYLNVGNMSCVSVEYNPSYDPAEMLKESNVLVSVVRLQFKEIVNA